MIISMFMTLFTRITFYLLKYYFNLKIIGGCENKCHGIISKIFNSIMKKEIFLAELAKVFKKKKLNINDSISN